MTVSTQAAPVVSVEVNPANTIPNVVANSIFADGDGNDWTVAALYLELDRGGVYNSPQFDLADAPSGQALSIFPDVEFDSWAGIIDDGGGGVFAHAGDLGGPFMVDYGLIGAGQQTISAAWFNIAKTDLGDVRIGNISLSDDATGAWSLAVTFAHQPKITYLSNPVINGEMVWEPLHGDLLFDGFVGINDLNTVLGAWNQSVTPGDRRAGEPSGDGFVGIDDLNLVLGNWNAGFAPPPSVEPGLLERDYNGDGYVGIDDQNIVMTYWNENVTPGDQTRGDNDWDGFIGISDMAYRSWDAGTPPQPVGGYTPPIVIPEPAALNVLVLAGSALLRRRA